MMWTFNLTNFDGDKWQLSREKKERTDKLNSIIMLDFEYANVRANEP